MGGQIVRNVGLIMRAFVDYSCYFLREEVWLCYQSGGTYFTPDEVY